MLIGGCKTYCIWLFGEPLLQYLKYDYNTVVCCITGLLMSTKAHILTHCSHFQTTHFVTMFGWYADEYETPTLQGTRLHQLCLQSVKRQLFQFSFTFISMLSVEHKYHQLLNLFTTRNCGSEHM
jgi:hypothetical protein